MNSAAVAVVMPIDRAMRARVSKGIWRSMTDISFVDRSKFAVIIVTIVAKVRKYLSTYPDDLRPCCAGVLSITDSPRRWLLTSQIVAKLRKLMIGECLMSRMCRLILLLLAAVAVSGFFSATNAAQKGSETKGRHFFKDTCRKCHAKGGAGGELTPMNKTMAQWRAYFAAGTHNHGKEPLTQYLPADQLLDASAFLINHAADSPQPETCGK